MFNPRRADGATIAARMSGPISLGSFVIVRVAAARVAAAVHAAEIVMAATGSCDDTVECAERCRVGREAVAALAARPA